MVKNRGRDVKVYTVNCSAGQVQQPSSSLTPGPKGLTIVRGPAAKIKEANKTVGPLNWTALVSDNDEITGELTMKN